MPDQPTRPASRLDSMNLPPELPQVPHRWYEPGLPAEEAAKRYFEVMNRRRSVRFFSDKPVSRETVEWIVRTGGTAPSGAHKQPWRFVCVNDPGLKKEIRGAAEADGTDASKPFLEIAPWLIIVFQLSKTDEGGMVYYREESVGIATGMLISAIHHAGLVTLTHTPSPMKFLSQVLGRPDHERPFLLLPVGYPAPDATVPRMDRKPLKEIMVVNRGE